MFNWLTGSSSTTQPVASIVPDKEESESDNDSDTDVQEMPPPRALPSKGIFPAPNSAQRASAPGGRRKVALSPGHSPLDWAKIKEKRQIVPLARITPSELAMHNTKEDAWMAIQGKVYDVSEYNPFHPG
jgi:cytochrome b involved in lipid metabolism